MKSKIAVYPGTFDPLTNGHVDIVKRSLALFDQVIIAVAVNSKKQSLFSVVERIALIEKVLKDEKKLIVTQLEGLTADFCKEKGAVAIIRGLRAVADFDYEYAISILKDCKELMLEGAEILKRDKILKAEQLIEIINNKYSNLIDISYC
jgi:pantetheine-phosphate adenylyltransferase